MAVKPGRNDPCPCGSGAKFKRCCLDSARNRTEMGARAEFPSDPRAETHEALTLFIETEDGMAIRRVADTSVLDDGVEQGLAAENAVQDAAALWGLPDFVYAPAVQARASGVRELGDGILIVGELAVVVQVKSRVGLSADPAKERRWIEKKMADAVRQAHGTIRSLREQPAELVSARGRRLMVDGNDYRWVAAVVIDHPEVPAGIRTPATSETIAVLRRDWEFLFEQLKSTHAVAAYFERAAGESLELGREPARYYEFATADAATPPETLEPALTNGTTGTVSLPLLPLAPAASDDRSGHLLVRSVFEDLATTSVKEDDEGFVFRALGELDRLPVSYRGEIGEFLVTALKEVSQADSGETLWRLRTLRGPAGHAHLAFGAASMFSDAHQAGFSAWVQLKHHDLQQITHDPNLVTVGVLLTPRNDGYRLWDTSMTAVRGDLELTAEDLAAYREIWPGDGLMRAA